MLPNPGFLDDFLNAKAACEKATREFNAQDKKCKKLNEDWKNKKKECNDLQDAMDDSSCKAGIGAKGSSWDPENIGKYGKHPIWDLKGSKGPVLQAIEKRERAKAPSTYFDSRRTSKIQVTLFKKNERFPVYGFQD